MSTTMPEFEMPPEVPPPPRPDGDAPRATGGSGPAAAASTAAAGAHGAARAAASGRTDLVLDPADPTAEPEPAAADAHPPAGRPRLVWRHLLVAGVIGALVGAAVPGAVQAIDRASAAAEVEGLRTLASEYLTAIAEQRADDATALVPLESGRGAAAVSPAAMLAAASPIERAEVRLVHVDGSVGSVEVRYRVAGGDVFRTLEAERLDGRWRLLTSLAEHASVLIGDAGVQLTLAGSPLSDRRTRLYPGAYEVDRVEGPVFAVGGERFVVDGDPRTPTEVFGGTELAPALSDLASAYALAAAAACQRSGTCEVADDVLLGGSGGVHVQWSDLPRGVVQLSVPLVEDRGSSTQWIDMEVRLTVDPGGAPVSWECGVPGEYGGELSPCPAIG